MTVIASAPRTGTGDGPSTPQPLPTHGSDASAGGTTGAAAPTPADPNGNWVLGTDYTDQIDARKNHTVAWHVWSMIGLGAVGGAAGWFSGYGAAKVAGITMKDSSGYMSGKAVGFVTIGLIGTALAGAAAGWFAGNKIEDIRNPLTSSYPERKLVTGYTDSRLPMVLESGLKVADVQGTDKAGSKTGTMQVFTSGNPEKAGNDREAAIKEAKSRVLESHKKRDGSSKVTFSHDTVAVLQTAGGQYYLAPATLKQSEDVGQRFDSYQVRSTDPALVALVTPSALYRA